MDDENEAICTGCCTVVPTETVDAEGYCEECAALLEDEGE